MPPGEPIRIALDEQGRVDEDADCCTCAYNLRGLAWDAACPECGTAVAESVGGHLLRYSDPEWISRLADGAGWMIAGMLFSIVSCQMEPAWIMQLILGTVVWGSLWQGVLRLTEPEPGRVLPAFDRERRFARATLAAYPFMIVLGAIGGVDQSLSELTLAAGGVRTVLMCLVIWSLGRFGQAVALRLADPKLARSVVLVSRVFATLTAASFVILLGASGFLKPTTGGGGFTVTLGGQAFEPTPWLAGIVIVLTLGSLVFAIWALVLPFQFRKRLKLAGEQAAMHWARGRAERD
jgi:hypothetical protein